MKPLFWFSATVSIIGATVAGIGTALGLMPVVLGTVCTLALLALTVAAACMADSCND